MMRALVIPVLIAALSLCPAVCLVEGADSQPAARQAAQKNSQQPTAGKNQDIQNVKPKKPVKVKLHRNANGQYSWDITGDNVDEVYKADSRLRKLLKIDQ